MVTKKKKFIDICMLLFLIIFATSCGNTQKKVSANKITKQKTNLAASANNETASNASNSTSNSTSNGISNAANNTTNSQTSSAVAASNARSTSAQASSSAAQGQSSSQQQAAAQQQSSSGQQGASPQQTAPSKTAVTFTGYIQDEDCLVTSLDVNTGKPNLTSAGTPYDQGYDSRICLLMKTCLDSGDGVIVDQGNGNYKYYYFDGDFATGNGASWTPPTGSELLAYNIIKASSKANHLKVTVSGYLDGTTRTNTNSAVPAYRDGVYYPVIKVTSIAEAN